MAIAQAQFTSRESKMADNEVEIGFLPLLSRRNRRRLLMQRQTQRKPRKFWIRDIFTSRKTQGDYYNLVQELFLSLKSADFCRTNKDNCGQIPPTFRSPASPCFQLTDSDRAGLDFIFVYSVDKKTLYAYAYAYVRPVHTQVFTT